MAKYPAPPSDPLKPKPTAGPRMVKPQPAVGPRKPRPKMPKREMPKRMPKRKDQSLKELAVIRKPARKKPEPPKQGPEELAAINKYRQLPKRIGKIAEKSMDTDLRQMGMSRAQKETLRRDMLNDMRSRNVLRAKKKRG